MASDNDAIEEVTEARAFKRKWKRPTKHTAKRFLPDEYEYDVMLICSSAAGDVTVGAQWFETMPLSQVYKWLAIRLAQIDEE